MRSLECRAPGLITPLARPHATQIMIAEPGSRGKGLATEALTMLMAYAADKLVRA